MTAHLRSTLRVGFRSEACEISHGAGLPFALLDTHLSAGSLGSVPISDVATRLPGPGRVTVLRTSSHTASSEELERQILFLFIWEKF